jgi:HD-GYP domain-containing protein (c-di-GMP phosphodiesterase class II)
VNTQEKNKTKVLFASPDEALIKKLKESSELKKFECYFALSGGEAQKLIKDLAYKLNICFIDPLLSNPSGLDVVKFCHLYQTAVSIYLYSSDEKETLELEKIGVLRRILHQIPLPELLLIIEPFKVQFKAEEALEISKKFNDKEGAELSLKDQEFVPVQAANFISGQKSFFDLYVRLNSGKFVKILNAGDDFKFERIKSYLDKGVTYFFVRKDGHKSFVDYINLTMGKVLKVSSVTIEVKNKQLLFLGEETSKIFTQFNLAPENLVYATEFVDKLHQHLRGIKDKGIIAKFLKNVLTFEHCSGVAFISGLIAKKLEIDSHKSITTLGTAAILHDVGLYRYREEFTAGYDDIEYFDEENIEMRLEIFRQDRNIPGKEKLEELEKVYEAHPSKGAQQLNEIPGTDPLVAQIIRQHHLRRNGLGMHKKNKDEMIHPMSEVVGLSDDFIKIMKLINKGKSMVEVKEKMEQLNEGFSIQTHRAFREVFFPTSKN